MRTTVLFSALLLTGAGCDSDVRGDVVTEGFPAPSHWQVQSVGGDPVPAMPNDAVFGTVTFAAAEVSGIGGCNGYGGSYAAQSGGVVGNRIQIGGLSATEIYCGDVLHPFEERMFAALQGAQQWEIEADGALRLSGTSEGIVLLPMLVGAE